MTGTNMSEALRGVQDELLAFRTWLLRWDTFNHGEIRRDGIETTVRNLEAAGAQLRAMEWKSVDILPDDPEHLIECCGFSNPFQILVTQAKHLKGLAPTATHWRYIDPPTKAEVPNG